MSITSTGDLAHHFMSTRRTSRVKDRLMTLQQELGSGKVADVSLHLGGDAARLAHLEHRTGVIDSHLAANRLTEDMLSHMQLSLNTMEARRSELAEHVLSLPISITDTQLVSYAKASRLTFDAMVDDLNLSVGDRSLFAGAATDRRALADADSMLASLKAAVASATTAADVVAAVDSWFHDVGGGFETMGYLGDDGGYVVRRLGDGTSATIDLRADDAAFRELLASAALGAVLEGGLPGLSQEEAKLVARESGMALLSAASPLAQVQGALGRVEGLVEASTIRQLSERTSLAILRNDLVSADPFQTAAQLREVETQLQMAYQLTARLANLTLADYI